MADGYLLGTYPYVDPYITIWDIEAAAQELQPYNPSLRQVMEEEIEYLHDHDTPSPYQALLAKELGTYTAQEFSEGWVLFWMGRIGWQELLKIIQIHTSKVRPAEALVRADVASWATG